MAHAAAKGLAFLAAGAWLTLLGTKVLPELRGTARRHRTVGVAFTVAALALAGVPPLSLWAAKDVLLAAALEDGPWLYAAGLAAAVISAAYGVKALWFVWQPDADGRAPARMPSIAGLPLVALALACAALTPLAFPPVRDAVIRVLGDGDQVSPHAWEFALSAGLALTASVAAWAWGARAVRLPPTVHAWLGDWLHLENAARALLVRPVLALAHALAAFDDRVLDRGVEGAARGVVRLARRTDRGPERRVDGVVERVASTAGAFGRWARMPQTGQLHQYLAQAVAAFTVLAVVFVLVR
jgi:NADH:ubiquinone oxidoreductase subunit 5 (subunit L)/multisubunit Na+/H+ antiporter MnhA subunit